MPFKIDLIPNGPIRISSDDESASIQPAEGEPISLAKPVFLCRCGSSQNKPYCDGAHRKADYSDENRCDRDAVRSFEAPGITVHFNRAICSGAAKCVHNLPSVFRSDTEDWIHPAEAPVEDVVATVKKCPSGALSYTIDGETTITAADEDSIRIVKNGPYEISGEVEFEPAGRCANASRSKFALCRCGQSSNAPFCDYSHGEQEWRDDA